MQMGRKKKFDYDYVKNEKQVEKFYYIIKMNKS